MDNKIYDMIKNNASEASILRKLKSTITAEEKVVIKLELIHMFGYEKKIAEFKEKLMYLKMEEISISDLPFINVESYKQIQDLGIKTFYYLCHFDLNVLESKVSKDTFDDVMRFADTADVYVSAGIIEAC